MFNTYTVVAALLVGASAGGAGVRSAGRGRATALLVAVGVGIIGSGVACAFAVAGTGVDFFTLVHVAYLVATLAVPLSAAILVVGLSGGWRFRLAMSTPILLVPFGLYASHVEPFWLRVDEVTLVTDHAGVRIGVLSDLQTTEIGDYENDAIDRLIAADPDIVFIPGDFWQLDASTFDERFEQFAGALDRLDTAVPFVVAVNGNTDTLSGLRRLAQDTEVIVLDNEVVDLEFDGVVMRIAGISLHGEEQRADAAVERITTDDPNAFRVLLAHQPDEIVRLDPDRSVDLVVAGHTHGGQIRLPFLGPPVTFSSVPRSVAAGGLHQLDGTWIYVSTGVGRERGRAPQVRFGVRPSLGIIDLVEN